MPRHDFDDLYSFLAVARARSFTKAAAQLGISQSALSHTVSNLEARLGVRLLARTTRSVAPTEAGQRLFDETLPLFEGIQIQIEALGDLQGAPRGTVRINSSEHAIDTILWPKLAPLIAEYPDIQIELNSDQSFADIVAEQFDAGVRLGSQVADGMIAMRIGPDLRMAVVGSPAYFNQFSRPATPRELTSHRCINLRFPTYGHLFAWEFTDGKESFKVRVEGQLTFNRAEHVLRAACNGHGLAYVMEDRARPYLETGELEEVLTDWSPYFAGHHLYYSARRQTGSAFALVVEALRGPSSDRP